MPTVKQAIESDSEPTLRVCCERCERRLGDYVFERRGDPWGLVLEEPGTHRRTLSTKNVRRDRGDRGPRTGAAAFDIEKDPRMQDQVGVYARWRCGCGTEIKRRMSRLLSAEVHPSRQGPPIIYV